MSAPVPPPSKSPPRKDKTFRSVVVVFALSGAVLIAVTAVALRNLNRAQRSAEWVDHTRATLSEIDALLSNLQSAEGAVRTYIFTGSEVDRTTYRDAFNDLGERVEIARALISSYPDQLEVFAELEQRMVARANLARELLAAKQEDDTPVLQKLLAEDDAGLQLFEIRRHAQQIRNHFIGELSRHDRQVFADDQRTRTALFSVAGVTLLLLLSSAWFIRDDLRHRRTTTSLLRQANARLGAEVKEGAHELESVNLALKRENLEHRWRTEALDHQVRYFQRIVDSVSDLVFVTTKVGHISRINPAVVRRTGFDAPMLVNQSITDYITPVSSPPNDHDVPSDRLIIRALELGDELQKLSVHLRSKERGNLAAVMNLSPLHDRDEVIGAVITLRIE